MKDEIIKLSWENTERVIFQRGRAVFLPRCDWDAACLPLHL